MFCGYWIWGLCFLTIAGIISIASGGMVHLFTKKKEGKAKKTFPILVAFGVFFLMTFGCLGYYGYCSSDFDCDRGFGDYWRVPVRYPYQISSIDTLDKGCIDIWQKNDQIVCGVTHYAVLDSVMVGRIASSPSDQWFSFNFETEEIVYYPSEQALMAVCEKFGVTGKPELKSIRQHYDEN